MFYVLEGTQKTVDQPIALEGLLADNISQESNSEDYSAGDVDVVDDALLNTAPHNAIERQLLTGDVVGLALMSGAIIWSAMGAFG